MILREYEKIYLIILCAYFLTQVFWLVPEECNNPCKEETCQVITPIVFDKDIQLTPRTYVFLITKDLSNIILISGYWYRMRYVRDLHKLIIWSFFGKLGYTLLFYNRAYDFHGLPVGSNLFVWAVLFGVGLNLLYKRWQT